MRRALSLYRFRIFVGLLFVVIFVSPVVSEILAIDTTPFGLTVIVIAAYRVGGGRLGWLTLLGEIAILSVIWACSMFPLSPLEGFQYMMVAGLLLFVVNVVGSFLRDVQEIDQEALAASVCAYLLFGFACGALYAAFESWWPNGIVFSTLGRDPYLFDFVYFSFVVLTTIGFGDVIPVNAMSRSLAMIEGIIGLFFLAIVVSRLVSLYHQKIASQKAIE